MRAFFRYLKAVIGGAWSIVLGYTVTLGEIWRPIITVPYPREKLEMDPAYRGHIELVQDPDFVSHMCLSCGTCVRACPSGVIKVQGAKAKASATKLGMSFVIDFSRCSLCGLCVDVCPVGAIKHSMEYEMAHYSRWDSTVDLVARYNEQKGE